MANEKRQIKHPYSKDCPRRSGDCHAKCEEYLAYEAAKHEEYRKRAGTGKTRAPSPGAAASFREASRNKRAGHRHHK